MQVRFESFKWCISWNLEGIQSPDLAGVQAKLAVLWKSVEELHNRLILSMPTIEEIYKEEGVENIWSVDDSNPTSSEKVMKIKMRKRRRMEEQHVFRVSWIARRGYESGGESC